MNNAAIIIIGNEILSGRTQDQNIAYLGKALHAIGIIVEKVILIKDDEATIIEEVQAAAHKFRYIFTTGGIGPTHDDITAAAIAKACGQPLVKDDRAVALLQSHYMAQDLNAARLKMAYIPQGATLILNPISTAPGFFLDYEASTVFVLAGVPLIMQAMFEGIKHTLKGGAPVLSMSLHTHALEGEIAEVLSQVQATFPEVEIGSYPYWSKNKRGVHVVLRGIDQEELIATKTALLRYITFVEET